MKPGPSAPLGFLCHDKSAARIPHIKQRELLAGQTEILKKLTQMDAKLLMHDDALRVIWRELQPLLAPPPALPKKEIGFHIREDTPKYRPEAKARDEN